METDDDLLCVRIDQSTGAQAHNSKGALCTSIKTKLSEQLPGDFELVSVEVTEAKSAPQPRAATYVLAVRQEYVNEKLKARIEGVLASESLNVQRRIAGKNSKYEIRNTKFKNVDVRGFLGSIKLVERDILIECKISSAGSIRVEEMLKLLELDTEKLSAPIRRSNVQFVTCDS